MCQIRWEEIHWKEGFKASSINNMRGGGRPNIWKKSDEETDTHDDETN
jgi:hypothetical protein